MSLRVVGAGLGRTGTHSLKLALETLLDAPCYHMIEIRERPADADVWQRAAEGETLDLTAAIAGYAATVDWPAAAFWRQLSQENPDAVILLSTRASSEEWWESANSTIFENSRQMEPGPVYHMLNSLFPQTFTANFSDHDPAVAAYEAHNAAVRRDAPPHRLVEWQPGDSWQPLCDALDMPIPDQPFPHSNARADFPPTPRMERPDRGMTGRATAHPPSATALYLDPAGRIDGRVRPYCVREQSLHSPRFSSAERPQTGMAAGQMTIRVEARRRQ